MNRLTERTKYGIVGNNDRVSNYPLYKVANSDPLDHHIIEQCFNKLADYEDDEEQGLLLRLPCKECTNVYKIINQRDNFDDRPYKIVTTVQFDVSMIKEIGKTIFLTKEQANQKLDEVK